MANFTIIGFDSTAKVLNNGEVGFVGASGELVVNGNIAVSGTGANRLVVMGNITASTPATGVDEAYHFDGTDVDVFVGASGSMVSARGNAVELIISSRGELLNSGVITADLTAVSITASDSFASINVANDGYINGTNGLVLNSGNTGSVISNTGVISANATAVSSGATGRVELVNSGTIASSNGIAISFGSGSDLLINTGVIIGPINLGTGDDLFDGSAGKQVSDGFISLSGGEDTFLGGAFGERIAGGGDDDLIQAAGGDDTIRGDGDLGDDTYDGGSGNDLVDYGARSNPLYINLVDGLATGDFIGRDELISIENVKAGLGDDFVIGDDANNAVLSGGGDDRVDGNGGNDRLRGSGGNDTLRGGDGNDRLFGQGDDDRLFGGAGNDLIVGGLGRDNMTGDGGSDTFAFFDIADSGTSGADRDRISDFTQGADRIDLSSIDADTVSSSDDAFSFIGTNAFSGTAAEVRYRNTATLTLVEVDHDGDGTADMSIRVDGVLTLLESDFIL